MQVSDNHLQAREYIKNIESLSYEQLADAMTFKWFRLCTLYNIKNKQGKKVLFTPNEEQETFYCGQHDRDIILKARQLGFTTFKMIVTLMIVYLLKTFLPVVFVTTWIVQRIFSEIKLSLPTTILLMIKSKSFQS